MALGSETLLFVRGLYSSFQAVTKQNVSDANVLFAELQSYFDLPLQLDGGVVVPSK